MDVKYTANETVFFTVILIIYLFLSLPSIQEFVKGCGSVTKRWVDGLLDKMTAGDHTKSVNQIRQVYYMYLSNYVYQFYPPLILS